MFRASVLPPHLAPWAVLTVLVLRTRKTRHHRLVPMHSLSGSRSLNAHLVPSTSAWGKCSDGRIESAKGAWNPSRRSAPEFMARREEECSSSAWLLGGVSPRFTRQTFAGFQRPMALGFSARPRVIFLHASRSQSHLPLFPFVRIFKAIRFISLAVATVLVIPKHGLPNEESEPISVCRFPAAKSWYLLYSAKIPLFISSEPKPPERNIFLSARPRG